jgi:serine/threonine protein phosphatase PrpC
MEDSILFKRISKDIFLFAVFDGHGGVEVSHFCAEHFPTVLENNLAFQRGEYDLALEQSFK